MTYKTEQLLRRLVLTIFGSAWWSFPLLYKLRLWAYRTAFHIGDNPVIENNVWISRTHGSQGRLRIGKNVLLARNVFIDYTGEVILEDDVWLSEGAQVHSHSHRLTEDRILRKKDGVDLMTVVLRKGCWIGACALILPGVGEIGEGAVVGAGSVVTRPVPAGVVVAGNPATAIRKLVK